MESAKRRVKVKLMNSDTFEFEVNPEILVSDFKKLVQEKSEVVPENQRLIFKAKFLPDDAKLSQFV